MKKVILFLCFMPVTLFCQISDDFETGNLSRWVESVPGHWKADTTKSFSGNYSLRHVFDNPAAGNDQIGIPLTNLQPSMGLTRWSFKIRYDNDPSSANNWGVFLISDKDPCDMLPGGSVSGFVIGVNLTGIDDTLRLWKIKNGNLSVVLNSGIKWKSDAGISVIVERSQGGLWKTEVVPDSGMLTVSSSVSDPELFNAEWFGVYYRYTATLDRLLRIDDIYIDGEFIEDVEPPEIIKYTPYTLNSVDLLLNEEPGEGFYSSANFTLNGLSEKAGSVLKISPVVVRVNFKSSFRNKEENYILINSLCDRRGNCKQNVTVRFTPVSPDPGDVIISEIMADPFPSVSLPEREYLEISNTTDFHFNLKSWKLTTDGYSTTFPETIINPHEQMILCQVQDTPLFKKYGRVTGLKSFPALTDGGRLIVLSDSSGNLIHGVEYSSSWYGDVLKKDGGWSLEMIDTEFPFFSEGNWTASVSRTGGTPGFTNSVNRLNPDKSFRGIVNVFPCDSISLTLAFSEPVKNLAENVSGIMINGTGIKTAESIDPLRRKFMIKLHYPLNRHQTYNITIPENVTDFAGNLPVTSSFSFGMPEKILESEVVFNEILFNPLPGDADFIELYNSSSKIIDISELSLVSVNESGNYSPYLSVSSESRCVLPGSYYAISTDKGSLLTRFFSARQENVFQLSQLPSMPDDKGHLILYNRQFDLIDDVSYNEKMHFPLLSGYEGISLEKVRPSVPSSDPKNWHSASEAAGWGTPGAPNSIFSEKPGTEEKVILSSSKITPDNDGYEDLLVIDLKPGGNVNVLNISIYDETGSFICKLASNLLAGNQVSITWDATGEDGTLVNPGIYIILISVFDDTGKTEKWKKVCAVIR